MTTYTAQIGVVTTGYIWTATVGNYATEAEALASATSSTTSLKNSIQNSLTGLLPSGFVSVSLNDGNPALQLRSSQIVGLWPFISSS